MIIAACGTYYAGMVGKYHFEGLADMPAEVEQAAEFRYRNPIIERDNCLLAVSQIRRDGRHDRSRARGAAQGTRWRWASATWWDPPSPVKPARRLFACRTGNRRGVHQGIYLPGCRVGDAGDCLRPARRMSAPRGHPGAGIGALAGPGGGGARPADTIRKVADKYAAAEHFFYLGRGHVSGGAGRRLEIEGNFIHPRRRLPCRRTQARADCPAR